MALFEEESWGTEDTDDLNKRLFGDVTQLPKLKEKKAKKKKQKHAVDNQGSSCEGQGSTKKGKKRKHPKVEDQPSSETKRPKFQTPDLSTLTKNKRRKLKQKMAAFERKQQRAQEGKSGDKSNVKTEKTGVRETEGEDTTPVKSVDSKKDSTKVSAKKKDLTPNVKAKKKKSSLSKSTEEESSSMDRKKNTPKKKSMKEGLVFKSADEKGEMEARESTPSSKKQSKNKYKHLADIQKIVPEHVTKTVAESKSQNALKRSHDGILEREKQNVTKHEKKSKKNDAFIKGKSESSEHQDVLKSSKNEHGDGQSKKRKKINAKSRGDSLLQEDSPDQRTSKVKKKKKKKHLIENEKSTLEPVSKKSQANMTQEVGSVSPAKGSSPFNIDKLKSVLQSKKSAVSSNTSEEPPSQSVEEGAKKTKKRVMDAGSLRQRMEEQLKAARFRYINEQLYTCSGEEAFRLMSDDPLAFRVYHEGFQAQAAKWPQNPLNKVIAYVKKRPATLVVADFGCGDAALATSVDNTIHSFDLVAVNQHVTACDMADVPLEDSIVDVAVFCLSLMGTNISDFLCEANRVLRDDGVLLIAEVMSRFDKIGEFVRNIEKLGFTLRSKDLSNTMFAWFEFRKTGSVQGKVPKIELAPCVYKKR